MSYHWQFPATVSRRSFLRSAEEYNTILKGFKWLTPEECLKTFEPGTTMQSVIYASQEIGEFMVGQKLISSVPDSLEPHIDRQFVERYLKE